MRFGSRLGRFGGYVTTPLVMVDLYRELHQKFEPGSVPLKGEEAAAHGLDTGLKLAGAIFWEAIPMAITLEVAVKPGAEKASEYLTPMFIGGMSQAYGVPE